MPLSSPVKAASFWEPLENERVHCYLCPYDCKIAPGKRGYCRVRENSKGELLTLIYGLISAKAVDPIEKKPLYHFHPGGRVYSVGTIGCNFRCIHCQNWEIAFAEASNVEGGKYLVAPDELVREALDSGSGGIAWTYNEPTIWMEYAVDGAREAKAAGLYTAFVTNGYITDAGLDAIGPHLDAYRVDVKGFSTEFYRELAHVKDFTPVLRAAVRAKREWAMHVEIVTNVIPTLNDSDAEFTRIAEWIVRELGPETPWHVTRFFPHLELSHLEPTPISTLEHAVRIGKSMGIHHIYVGNVPGHSGENTYCPECGTLAIDRQGFSVIQSSVTDGRCKKCSRDLNIRSS